MKIALLCVGDELLKGATLNTNLSFIGSKLLEQGLTLDHALEIRDNGGAIADAVKTALTTCDIVITSGGLGPTADDMTKEYIARLFSLPLEQDGSVVFSIRRYWKQRHAGEPTGRVLNQSLIPKGSKVILNQFGTAPGLVIHPPEAPEKMVILLPGPPAELQPMFEKDVLPLIMERAEKRCYTKLFYICGVGESEVEERILPMLAKTHPLTAAYCATHEYVKLFLNSPDLDILADATLEVRAEFGHDVLEGSDGIAGDVVRLLKRRGLTIATAESCTGGLVAKMITDISGASDVFPGSVVSYANRIKESALGVRPETLESVGAVSRETVREMAQGIAERFGTDCAIALSGIAGPGGGTPEKPVGLVYCGIVCEGVTEVFEFRLGRSREQIRERAAAKALDMLRRMLLKGAE